MMQLVLTVNQRLDLCQCLDLTGGATESVFPEVEALLQASTEYQKALNYVARRKHNMDKYRSVIDFLCCELFTWLQPACFKFYLSGDRPLREMVTEGQRVFLAWNMLQALTVAYAAFSEDRRMSWSQLKAEVKAAG